MNKQKLLNLIPILIIAVIVIEFVFANRVQATESILYNANSTNEASVNTNVTSTITESDKQITAASLGDDPDEDVDSKFDNAIDGIAGVLLYPAKLLPIVIGGVLSVILGFFTQGVGHVLTLEDILFNRVPITNIDFFDLTGSGITEGDSSTIVEVRKNVAIWYTSIRNLAAIMLAIVCIYVGIRMALATLAEEKAKYNKMLYDWVFSLIMLFVMHFLIMFVIYINNALVSLIDPKTTTGMEDVAKSFFDASWSIGFIKGMGNAIAYMMLMVITLVFLMSYITRMVRIAFLILIAPLVTVTYSIDRMGDGKSQALNTWFKEFVYNILIQPFHCIAYAALGTIAVELLHQDGDPDLAAAVIGIVMLIFIFKAEDIVKHIFHFQSKSMGKTIGQAAFIGAAVGSVAKAREKVGKFTENLSNTSKVKSKLNEKPEAGTGKGGEAPGGAEGAGTGGAEAGGTAGAEAGGAEAGGTAGATTGGATAGGAEAGGAAAGSSGAAAGGAAAGGALAVVALAAQAVVNANKRVSRAAVGLALGGGLGGDPKNVVMYTANGWKKGAASAASYSESIRQKQLAGAYEDYMKANEGMSDDKAKADAKDLMNGTKVAETPEEIALRDRMLAMKDRYKYDGADDKEMNKKLNKTLDKIGDGDITRLKASQVFTGMIPKSARDIGSAAASKMTEIKNNAKSKRTASETSTPDAETPGGDAGDEA